MDYTALLSGIIESMSFRTWVSIITFLAIAFILYLTRHELYSAWQLLGRVNPYILALLIPAQLISYFAVGAMIFNYLRAKGELQGVSHLEMMRMALELNFVNHALPSGGVSGFSYLGWRLKQHGVSPGRATLAQVVRFVVSFGAFLVLLSIAVLALTVDGTVSRFAVYISSVLATTIVLGTLFGMYIIGSYGRLHSFSLSLTRTVNSVCRALRLPNKYRAKEVVIQRFFEDLHKDYVAIKKDKKILKRPLAWAFVFNIADIGMFLITFAALGTFINPAMVVIAVGIASVAGFFFITPGGAGAVELVMVWFLAGAGAPGDVTIAAIVLTRTLLILGTIISGYVFYQLAILKYGKQPNLSH